MRFLNRNIIGKGKCYEKNTDKGYPDASGGIFYLQSKQCGCEFCFQAGRLRPFLFAPIRSGGCNPRCLCYFVAADHQEI